MVTQLKDLTIERVAFVPAGDDPSAEVVFWKRRDRSSKGGGEADVLKALEALGAEAERTSEVALAAKRKADELLVGSGAARGSVVKAADAAARLYALAQRDLDRHPTDRSESDRTPEQALAKVVGTPEGRRALRARKAEGELGKQAFKKPFGLDSPEPSEPTRTAGERRIAEMAAAVAKARGLTIEQATDEVVRTTEGRAAFAAAVEERASARAARS
ncbi:MAG: hypothetical protein L0206_18880 [Actinobacteria bacterium]|nr:hypothetical protein [Actinomycetota bacterium]